MCAKFGCGPTVVSKKKRGGIDRQTDRQTKKTAALYSRYINRDGSGRFGGSVSNAMPLLLAYSIEANVLWL